MPRFKPLAALVPLLIAGTLAACTTQSQVCKDGVCKLSLSGKGATAELGMEGGSEIELLSAGGDEARVRLGSQEGTLKVGVPVELDNATLTLTEVKKDKLKLRIEARPGPDADETPTPRATTESEQTT